jgi:glycosyltransferase involved in cell wall biosynthesis
MRQIISNLRELTQLQIVWVKPKESTTIALNIGEDLVTTAAYKEMPALFQSSHFGLIVCKSDNLEVLTAVAPTKVAEFLASGRPILVSRGIGDLDSLIETYKVGVSLEPGIDMRDSLLRFMGLLKDPEIHIRCRQLAEEMFSMASAVEKYRSIYRKMAPND